jgi:hypothetical protein
VGVEGEAAEHVLQVDHRAGVGGASEQRQEPGLHLLRDDPERVGAHGDAAELQAGHLALVAPGVAVHVEDAASEEVPEERREGLALGEVVEVGLEHVLHVGRVGRDGAAQHVDVDGAGGRLPEEVRVPVAQVGEVPRPRPRQVRPADVAAAPGPAAEEQKHQGQRHHAERGGEEGHARALRCPGQGISCCFHGASPGSSFFLFLPACRLELASAQLDTQGAGRRQARGEKPRRRGKMCVRESLCGTRLIEEALICLYITWAEANPHMGHVRFSLNNVCIGEFCHLFTRCTQLMMAHSHAMFPSFTSSNST